MPDTLRLIDYSDRELLLVVMDEADGADGWASSEGLARRFGVKQIHSVTSRLAWLRRYGAVERDEERALAHWRPTAIGEMLATGDIGAAQQRALEGLKPEAMLMLTRFAADRARSAPETAQHLMKREWRRRAVFGVNGRPS